MIGGAVTFVNPEPLALFADVIAAGEGECSFRACRGDARPADPRSDVSRALRPRRGFYIPSFYDVHYDDDGTHRGVRAEAGQRRAAVVRKAAVKTTDRLDPPRTSIFTPDTEFGSRFLIEVVRGCANLCRFCWAGYNYLPVRAFPADRILELAARRQAVLVARRLCFDRAVRPPRRSSGSSPASLEMGYSISPASLRLDDLTEPDRALLRRAANARSRSRRRPDRIACAG